MLVGFGVVVIGTLVAIWINDKTSFGGPEFSEVADEA